METDDDDSDNGLDNDKDDDDVTEDEDAEDSAAPPVGASGQGGDRHKTVGDDITPKTEDEDETLMAGPLSEWFNVKKDDSDDALSLAAGPEDSDTENDSDNADNEGEEPDLDDWFSVNEVGGPSEEPVASTSTSFEMVEETTVINFVRFDCPIPKYVLMIGALG